MYFCLLTFNKDILMQENWAWMSPKKEKRCTVPYTMEGLINWARAGGNYVWYNRLRSGDG